MTTKLIYIPGNSGGRRSGHLLLLFVCTGSDVRLAVVLKLREAFGAQLLDLQSAQVLQSVLLMLKSKLSVC